VVDGGQRKCSQACNRKFRRKKSVNESLVMFVGPNDLIPIKTKKMAAKKISRKITRALKTK